MLTRMNYDRTGGRAYLFQLMEVTPGARNVNEYVRIVRDKSLLRQLADAGSEIQQNALEAHGEASGIAELAEQRIYGIRRREIKVCHGSEVIADLPNWTGAPGRTVKFPACLPASTRWTRR